MVQISHLTKTYLHSDNAALSDINLSLEKNEILGLLGPNGAGKTTLISLLCGLIKPSSGELYIDNFNTTLEPHKIKKIIGLVPQDIALYSTLTCKENLEFFGSMYGIFGSDLTKKIAFWIEKLDLISVYNKRIEHLSGGMKRRVNLIASILHEPKLLILDEPTVGVDVESRNTIIELLKELNQQGTSIIYTSHHMEEAEDFCTTIAIINEGKIISRGTPEQLISSIPGVENLEEVFLKLTNKKRVEA